MLDDDDVLPLILAYVVSLGDTRTPLESLRQHGGVSGLLPYHGQCAPFLCLRAALRVAGVSTRWRALVFNVARSHCVFFDCRVARVCHSPLLEKTLANILLLPPPPPQSSHRADGSPSSLDVLSEKARAKTVAVYPSGSMSDGILLNGAESVVIGSIPPLEKPTPLHKDEENGGRRLRILAVDAEETGIGLLDRIARLELIVEHLVVASASPTRLHRLQLCALPGCPRRKMPRVKSLTIARVGWRPSQFDTLSVYLALRESLTHLRFEDVSSTDTQGLVAALFVLPHLKSYRVSGNEAFHCEEDIVAVVRSVSWVLAHKKAVLPEQIRACLDTCLSDAQGFATSVFRCVRPSPVRPSQQSQHHYGSIGANLRDFGLVSTSGVPPLLARILRVIAPNLEVLVIEENRQGHTRGDEKNPVDTIGQPPFSWSPFSGPEFETAPDNSGVPSLWEVIQRGA